MSNNIFSKTIDKYNLSYLNLISCLIIINVLIICAILIFPNIGIDGGYYLSIGRDIYQGRLNFFETVNLYTPIGILLFSIPYFFTSNFYILSLIILVAFQILNSILVFKTLEFLGFKGNKIKIISLIYLSYSLLLDGSSIILEPIQIFFALISVNFVLRKNFFLSGLFIFLSFFTKQYSLVFIPAFAIYILKSPKIFINTTKFFIGFVLPIGLAYVLFFKNYDFEYYILRLLGKDILMPKHIIQTGINYSFITFIKMFSFILFFFPLVFIWILNFNLKKISVNILFFILIFSSSFLIFYFASYPHYFQLILPWGIILFVLFMADNLNQFQFKLGGTYVLLTVMFFSIYTIWNRANNYINQKKLTKKLEVFIPKNSIVLFEDNFIPHYIYGSYYSSNLRFIGYSSCYILPFDYYLKNIKIKSFIVTSNKKWLEKTNESLRLIYIDNDIFILKKIY
jgi:hypothetical protein